MSGGHETLNAQPRTLFFTRAKAGRESADRRRSNGDNRTFNGSIDEVAVFARTLTAAEILRLYTGAPAVSVSIEAVGPKFRLTRPQGTLESALGVTGPYTTVPGATSPYTNSASGGQRFFQVLVRP